MCAVFFTLMATATGLTAAASSAAAAQPAKIKMVLLPYLSFSPFFIAQEEGLFDEMGLDVEFIKMSTSAQAMPMLMQGKLDVGTGIIGVNLLNAATRGGNVKIVADKGHFNPNGCAADAILVRKAVLENKKADMADVLRGKRIAINPYSTDSYFVEKALTKIGLPLEELQVKGFLPPPMRAKALQTNAIDIVNTSEPWITRITQNGSADLWMPASDVAPDFQYAVIIYGPNLLVKNRKLGQQFMTAYMKAVRTYNLGKTTRNVQIISKYTGLAPDLLAKTCWPSLNNDGRINVDSVLDFQKWAMDKGLLDKVVETDGFWDASFVENAERTLAEP
jgi:NitT/TauT family transport system substrate-binding protein